MFCTQNTAFTFNSNHEEDDEEPDQLTSEQEEDIIIPKEPLFEKPLTPSDVGKLNRLVIPKQHAEKYFPLSSSGNNDSIEKSLLLSFEDELGKSWKFRYSYWNSSQSYVLTKGWSRFVKEKRLDAGDILVFERHRHDGDRFLIGWRRKGTPATTVAPVLQDVGVARPSTVGGGGGWTPVFYSDHPYPSHGSHLPYHQPDYIHAGGSVPQNQTSTSGHPKRLRLFGVNLECQPDHQISEPSTPDSSSSLSSHDPAHKSQQQQYQHYSHTQQQQQEEDTNFSRDVNQIMRYRHG